MSIDICNSKEEIVCSVTSDSNAKIEDLKRQVSVKIRIPIARVALRLELKGKNLSDDLPLSLLGQCVKKLYVKDLGPQISWKLVFLLEYIGPLLIYTVMFLKPACIYHINADHKKSYQIQPFILWYFHFIKRILETLFVHRFSHATMPTKNMFKNCAYYWGFAALIAYHINHPLYTPPFTSLRNIGTIMFLLCEMGNFSIHVLLRDLRPPGTKARRVPYPTSNPFTHLYNYVSSPNYTYEFGAWCGYSLVVNCFYVTVFMFVGFCQMTVWAIAKHHRYIEEFNDYPRRRRIIIPFLV